MNLSEHYEMDLLFYFRGHSAELALYNALFDRLASLFPEGSVKVQKSQISFYNRHLFAAVSLPVRRKKDWPQECLLITIGLRRPLDSPRAVVKVEPYPGRWTNHVLLCQAADIDNELLGWLQEAWDFAQSKR